MKLQDLIQSAAKKGYRHEFSNGMVGFCKKFVYHWFKTYDSGNDAEYFFDHSYSTNTGKSKRGLHHGWSVQDSLGI